MSELHKLISSRNLNSSSVDVESLKKENEYLKQEIEIMKKRLVEEQEKNGKKQFLRIPSSEKCNEKPELKEEPVSPVPSVEKPEKKKKPAKKEVTPKRNTDSSKTGENNVEEPPVDVGRLDFRIGKIINVKKHPDADTLYVEEIDVGEGKRRTVVSGLVKHVPIEEMQNRVVVLLCNLKPAKMRGVTSEAMVMCASSAEKVEILTPPPNSVPGDTVHVDGYPRNPDAVLNPKKKIFETVAPDLKTDSNLIATYKGSPLTVPGKGAVTAKTLADVNIK